MEYVYVLEKESLPSALDGPTDAEEWSSKSALPFAIF